MPDADPIKVVQDEMMSLMSKTDLLLHLGCDGPPSLAGSGTTCPAAIVISRGIVELWNREIGRIGRIDMDHWMCA